MHKLKINQSKNYYASTYQRQLLRIAKDTMAYEDISKLKYRYSDLSDYVFDLNKTKGFETPSLYLKKDSTLIQFRLGATMSNMSYGQDLTGTSYKRVEFDKQIIYSASAEIEFIPSMIKKNYGFLLEFIRDLNEYQKEKVLIYPAVVNPNYQIGFRIKNNFKLNFGVKRYFDINKNTSIYVAPKISLRSSNIGNFEIYNGINRVVDLYNRNYTLSIGANYKNLIFESSYVFNQNKDFSNALLIGLKYNIFNFYRAKYYLH